MNALWVILGVIGIACILLIFNHDSGSVLGIENTNFAQLVWLGVWGTVIGAAMLPRAGQWRAAARNLLIWLGIVIVLMTGYLYRYELQDVANRFTAGLVPGSPVSSTDDSGRSTTLLHRVGNGQFAARGEVNGEAVDFLVDTGANVVVLSPSDARRIGLDPDRLQYNIPVTTANGRTTAARVSIDSIRVGEIMRRNVDALVARPGALDTSLLGMSFLSRLHSFEFRGDRLILTD